MEKPMNSDADRAARAQADSVTAPAATPTAASIAWTALRDLTDPLGEAGVKIMGHVRIYAQRQYEAGLTEGRTTPPIHAAGNVLEDAARWRDWAQAFAGASAATAKDTVFMQAVEAAIRNSGTPFTAEQFTSWVDAARKQGGKP